MRFFKRENIHTNKTWRMIWRILIFFVCLVWRVKPPHKWRNKGVLFFLLRLPVKLHKHFDQVFHVLGDIVNGSRNSVLQCFL